MELVLQEIRQKISAGAGDAYPYLSSLSQPRVEPPAAPGVGMPSPSAARISASAESDAVVWGQDAKTLAKTRFHAKKMPRRRHTTAIVTVVVFLALLFMFAPVLSTNSGITSCHAASCRTVTTSYQSASFRAFGVGGVYAPQSGGWGTFGTGTIQVANGTKMSGIGLRQFYVVW